MSRKSKKALAKDFGTFLQQYRRKAQKGQEPNDRAYDPDIQKLLIRLKPEELDALMHGENDDDDSK